MKDSNRIDQCENTENESNRSNAFDCNSLIWKCLNFDLSSLSNNDPIDPCPL